MKEQTNKWVDEWTDGLTVDECSNGEQMDRWADRCFNTMMDRWKDSWRDSQKYRWIASLSGWMNDMIVDQVGEVVLNSQMNRWKKDGRIHNEHRYGWINRQLNKQSDG